MADSETNKMTLLKILTVLVTLTALGAGFAAALIIWWTFDWSAWKNSATWKPPLRSWFWGLLGIISLVHVYPRVFKDDPRLENIQIAIKETVFYWIIIFIVIPFTLFCVVKLFVFTFT